MKPVRRPPSKRRGIFLVVLLAALIVPVAGIAQEQPPGQPGQQQAPAPDQSAPLPPASAPVTDQEISQFAAAATDLRDIQARMQQEAEALIEQSALSRDRFVEILQSGQSLGAEDPAGPQGTDVTDAERQEFNALVEKINAVQNRYQQEMVRAVTDSGLTPERFNEILTAVQSDPALAERVQPYLQGQPAEPGQEPRQQAE